MKQLRGALAALGVLLAIWAILAAVGYFMDAFPPRGGARDAVDAGAEPAADAGVRDAGHAHFAAATDAGTHAAPRDAGTTTHVATATTSDAGVAAADAGAPLPVAPPAQGPVLARFRLCDGASDAVSLSVVSLASGARPELAAVCDGAAVVLSVDVVGGGGDAHLVPRRVVLARVPPGGRGPQPVVSAVVAADVDGDTRTDLAVGLVPSSGGGAGGLVLLPRDATGAFGRARSLAPVAVADLLAAPLDARDGQELVVLSARGALDTRPSEVWTFAGPTLARAALLRGPRAGSVLSAADLDGDGHLDLIAASGGDEDAVAWLGDGRGFPRTETLPVHAVRGAIAGDLDRDGEADVVLAGDHAGLVRRAPPPPLGTDAAAPHVLDVVPLEAANGVRHLVAADVDGAPGAELVGYAPPSLVALRRPAAPGAAPLAFERRDLRAFRDGEPVPLAIAAADLDGDGNVDLAFLGRTADGAPVELVLVRDVAALPGTSFADHADPVADAPLALALSVR